MMYTCDRALLALGFAPEGSIGPEHSIHVCDAVAADRGDRWAFSALESLVQAMVLERRVMIARYCFRKNSQPRIVALLPVQGQDGNAPHLLMQFLPFMEDMREWTCASLPASTADHRSAATSLIDAMDLERGSVDAKQAVELFRPEDTHNPSLTRFYNFVTQRALNAKAKVPPPALELVACLSQPLSVAERIDSLGVAERLKKAFNFREVETKKGKQRRFWREAIAEKRKEAWLEEVDTKRIRVDALPRVGVKKYEKDEIFEGMAKSEKAEDSQEMRVDRLGMAAAVGVGPVVGIASAAQAAAAATGPPPKVHIGSVNPVRDFEALLAQRVGSVDIVGPAVEKMCVMVERLAEESADYHGKALSCLTALRTGCVHEHEAVAFNSFVRRLARTTASSRQVAFWSLARGAKLGLITDDEVASSTVSACEARAFLAGEEYAVPFSGSAATGSAGPSSSAPAPGVAILSDQDLEAMLE